MCYAMNTGNTHVLQQYLKTYTFFAILPHELQASDLRHLNVYFAASLSLTRVLLTPIENLMKLDFQEHLLKS